MSAKTIIENKPLVGRDIARIKNCVTRDFVTKKQFNETLGNIETILQSI